jgi:uncharacterized MAPEG superfamily protein
MPKSLMLVVYMALVTWLMVMLSSLFRLRSWTPAGLLLALGNRDNMPTPSPVALRIDRATKNTIENFVFFAVLVLVARMGGALESQVAFGAEMFFWARIAYIPLYSAGIPYVRTVAWGLGIIGLGIVLSAIFKLPA